MTHEYNGKGVARQGDVLIFKLPENIEVAEVNEISPSNGKLVLLEGEMTGHHHAVDVLDRPAFRDEPAVPRKTNKTIEDMLANAASVSAPVVRMFADSNVPEQLVKANILSRTDLYIGTLTVEGGGDLGILVTHDEHDGIRLKAGKYYIGRQVESAGAEERMVQD